MNQLLTNAGIRPSYQRTMIFGYLLKTNSHPAAEAIFNALKGHISTLSLTTVYNTLNLLTTKGLINRLPISGQQARFDGFIKQHAHFSCYKCGRIYDVTLDTGALQFKEQHGFKVTDYQAVFKGICKLCKK